jgi:hypothetical protein
MRNERQRRRELEQLSAYLDGELEPTQRQALVARLQVEPDLQAQLEALRTTKQTLAYLPRLRAPHNYTLNPDMVTVRTPKRQPIFTSLRLASVLATVMLAVLFGVEFLFARGPLASPQFAAEPMMEAAMMVDEAEPAPLILWDTGHKGGDGLGYGMGGDTMLMEEPMLVEAMPVEVEVEVAVEAPEIEILPEEEPELMLEVEALPAPEEDLESLALMRKLEDDMLILGINLEQSGEIISRSADTFIDEIATPAWQMAVRVLQGALGIIALGAGMAWWLLRRVS